MPLLRLKAIDRKNQLAGFSIFPARGLGVLLTRGHHGLIAMDVIADGLVGELDRVGINEFVSDLGNRPMLGEPSMSDLAEDVPANRPTEAE